MKLRSLVIYGMARCHHCTWLCWQSLAILQPAPSTSAWIDWPHFERWTADWTKWSSAIDYVSLVRADWPTLEQLANDSEQPDR